MQDLEYKIDGAAKSLIEREKELECIYKIDSVLKNFDKELSDILLELIDIIPIGWRYPDICKVKISVFGIELESKDFKKTELNQSARLYVDENIVGEIILSCTECFEFEESFFLDEENRLFRKIVEKINQYLSFRKLKEFYSESRLKHNNNEHGFLKFLNDLNLSEEEIKIITKVPIEFKKGETICKQGSFTSFIMILKEGLVKAFIENSHYKNHVFKITKPYSIIGLSGLYGDNYYHFSCQALIPSKIYLVERSSFEKILRSNPNFAVEIMKIYSNSLQNIYDRLGSIANKQALGKVCDALIYLSEKVFESNVIKTSVTRKDIAEFSGLATENLVRILSDLKRDNIITINNKVIEIVNLDTLKMLSNLG